MLIVVFAVWAVAATIAAIVFGKRALQLDDLLTELNGIASDFGSFLKKKTSRGALVDSPEVREFHNKTIDFVSTMEQWSESVSKGEPIKRRSNADVMGSDPKAD